MLDEHVTLIANNIPKYQFIQSLHVVGFHNKSVSEFIQLHAVIFPFL